MQALIPGMAGSLTHRMSTELYQRHRDAGDGACVTCGHPTPCPTRCNATRVIAAAGDDPGAYEPYPTPAGTDLRAQQGTPLPFQPERQQPAHTGYHLGGRGRTLDPRGLAYDRDDP